MTKEFKIKKKFSHEPEKEVIVESITKNLLKKLKLTLILTIIIIWSIYLTIDIFIFHHGNLEKTIFTLDFHEIWVYLITFTLFILIYLFSHIIVIKQKEADSKYITLLESANDLFSSIKDGISIIDNNFNIIQVNPTILKWYSHHKQIIGKKCYEIFRNESVPCEGCLDSLNNADYKPNLIIIPKINGNGNQVGWLEKSIFPLIDKNNAKPLGVINYLRDVTKQKEAENLIIEENIKLLELDQLRKDLITRVSHELKTPLNAMYGATQLLLNYHKKNLNKDVLRYIESINKGGSRLNKLIEDLIDISKIEAKKLKLNWQKENLVEIIKETVEDIIYLVNERKLFLNIDIPKELFLDVDKIRIQQIIMNLMSNAIKNTPVNGNIDIKLHENGDYVDLYIRDSGIGLTNEEKERIFKKFGKIERYGESMGIDTEGSGLGLFISKEIIEMHGGKIWAESEGRNKGSTFVVRFLKTHPNSKIEEYSL